MPQSVDVDIDSDPGNGVTPGSTDNAIVRADGTTNNSIQGSNATIADTGTMTLTATSTTATGVAQSILECRDADGDLTFQILVGDINQRRIAFGRATALLATTASNIVAIGDNALRDLTTGNDNLAVGTDAGREIEAGVGSLLYGTRAGRDIVNNSGMICIGTDAGRGITGASIIAIGGFAGGNLTGNFDICIGRQAGLGLTNCTSLVVIGDTAGRTSDGQADGITNSIIIGATAQSSASNQAVLGNTSITSTILRGVVSIRRLTNACAAEIFNTFTSSTVFEKLSLRWATNVARIETEKGSGGGTARALALGTDSTIRLQINADGTINVTGASLPSSDPGVSGQLWLDSGHLAVSP